MARTGPDLWSRSVARSESSTDDGVGFLFEGGVHPNAQSSHQLRWGREPTPASAHPWRRPPRRGSSCRRDDRPRPGSSRHDPPAGEQSRSASPSPAKGDPNHDVTSPVTPTGVNVTSSCQEDQTSRSRRMTRSNISRTSTSTCSRQRWGPNHVTRYSAAVLKLHSGNKEERHLDR